MMPTALASGTASKVLVGCHPLALTTAPHADEPEFETLDFEDGTRRVVGIPPAAVREALLLTHVEGGRDARGRTVWHPKEADGDRD